MKRTAAKTAMALAAAALLVASALVIAGCSCSSQQSSSTGSSSSPVSASDVPMYTVPNVLSLTQADAEKSIVSSGLMVGTLKQEPSETVPIGCVVSQSPEPLTNAPANSKVDLVVSSGKPELKDVSVPDLKGKSQEEAEKALADAGLVGIATNPEESTEVAPGLVFKQSIQAGTSVKENTSVAFTVALAPAESTVPDVTGMTRDAAKKVITDAKLGFDYTTSYSNKVPEGKVINQSIAAGTKVKAGSTVSVTVSLGAKPQTDVKVPDVTTYSWSEAKAALRSAGLSARYTGDPAGVVVSQDVKPGTMVAPHTLVTVKLSSPVEMVKVPNLVGMSVESAEQATDAVQLALDVTSLHGVVVDQWPAAGTKMEVRTTVHATIDDSEFRDIDTDSEVKTQDADDNQSDESDKSADVKAQSQESADEEADVDDEPAAPAAPAAPAKKESKTISKDEAKSIALKDVGESEADVSKVDVKLVKEGSPHYEVTIVSDDTHYLYKIDAESGKILSSKATHDKAKKDDGDHDKGGDAAKGNDAPDEDGDDD